MRMIDFSYNGEMLSENECMIGSIVTSYNQTSSLGSTLSYETIMNNITFEQQIVNAKYEEPISVTFDIFKSQCTNNKRNHFTDVEISHIMRWLNQKTYKRFEPFYDNISYPEIYFMGSFNVTAINIAGKVIGFTLTFTSNAPFGYVDRVFDTTINESNSNIYLYNDSDEIGYIYPNKMTITCNNDNSSGTLTIQNSLDEHNMFQIANCVKNEVITLDCKNKIIQSSAIHPNLYNDFNYNFFRLVSSDKNSMNIINVSIPCKISIAYSIIRKAGVIV